MNSLYHFENKAIEHMVYINKELDSFELKQGRNNDSFYVFWFYLKLQNELSDQFK